MVHIQVYTDRDMAHSSLLVNIYSTVCVGEAGAADRQTIYCGAARLQVAVQQNWMALSYERHQTSATSVESKKTEALVPQTQQKRKGFVSRVWHFPIDPPGFFSPRF